MAGRAMQRVMREKEEAAAAAAAALGSADEEEEEVPVKRKPNAFAMVRMCLSSHSRFALIPVSPIGRSPPASNDKALWCVCACCS